MDALSPDGLVRVTPLEYFVDALSPDVIVTVIDYNYVVSFSCWCVCHNYNSCGHSLVECDTTIFSTDVLYPMIELKWSFLTR